MNPLEGIRTLGQSGCLVANTTNGENPPLNTLNLNQYKDKVVTWKLHTSSPVLGGGEGGEDQLAAGQALVTPALVLPRSQEIVLICLAKHMGYLQDANATWPNEDPDGSVPAADKRRSKLQRRLTKSLH